VNVGLQKEQGRLSKVFLDSARALQGI
jgi:hypothetical protein